VVLAACAARSAAVMSGAQARAHLALLGLSQVDAAELLGTNSRTVRRWVEDDHDAIPGPAEQALRAWARLHRAGGAWRPDHQALPGEDRNVQAACRVAAHAVSDALERVRRRCDGTHQGGLEGRANRATAVHRGHAVGLPVSV
jgi:transcriptional regulator with XRE-family HTH domain